MCVLPLLCAAFDSGARPGGCGAVAGMQARRRFAPKDGGKNVRCFGPTQRGLELCCYAAIPGQVDNPDAVLALLATGPGVSAVLID